MEDGIDVNRWVGIVLLIAALATIAIAAGAESALGAMSRSTLERLQAEGYRYARRFSRLAYPRARLRLAAMSVRALAAVVAAVAAAWVSVELAQESGLSWYGALVSAAICVAALIVLAEAVGGRLTLKEGDSGETLPRFGWTAAGLLWAMVPVASLLDRLVRVVTADADSKEAHEEELLSLVEERREEGVIDPHEGQMLNRVVRFYDTMAKEVMVPRIDMVCVEQGASLADTLALIEEKGHSRIPVYEETVDHIDGVLYAKDLLGLEREASSGALIGIMRKPFFVPETKKVGELLQEFKVRRTHLAIVVDEYGGTAGLVTMEDLLEEIVGDIQDEYDVEEQVVFRSPEGDLIVDAKLDVHDVNVLLKASELPRDDFETVGGFIYDRLGRIPHPGETVEHGLLRLSIESVDGQRITKVRIHEESPPPTEGEDTEDGSD